MLLHHAVCDAVDALLQRGFDGIDGLRGSWRNYGYGKQQAEQRLTGYPHVRRTSLGVATTLTGINDSAPGFEIR